MVPIGPVLLALAFLLVALEDAAEGVVPFSGLLAVLGTGLGLRRWRRPAAERLTAKFGKLWVAAEVMLFVLVGAEVDIGYAAAAGLAAVATVLGIERELGNIVKEIEKKKPEPSKKWEDVFQKKLCWRRRGSPDSVG